MTGAQKKIYAYKMKGSQKTREYELTGAQKKIDAYRLMDSQKTREYNLNGAQKTDENSSCDKVRKNDGVDIIHECQRKRACQDVDVKPVVRDPMDDDRVLVESGTEMTPQFHVSRPSLKNRNTISLTSHFNHGAHHASKAKHKRNHINEQSASSKTANSQ